MASPQLNGTHETPRLGGRLLVVEDDMEMRQLLRKVLEKEGFQVRVAEDGTQAMALLTAGGFTEVDAIVTDMLMPGDGGLDLLAKVRRARPSLPVIIVTAFGDWANYSRALELGAVAFISKPLKLAELTSAVQHALAGRAPA
jgi:DNA-binding NtrC family response regulator